MEKDNKRRKVSLNYLISIVIIIIFSKLVSSELSEDSIYSYIIMKMSKGNNRKVYNNRNSNPDEIYINGINQTVAFKYTLTEEENNITLIWKKKLQIALKCLKVVNIFMK